ncbi:MAG: TIGR02453 family protein [Bacteroidales bacterium]|nr:TIGR02453 family protein [Bacteroidales bacterium]
MIHSEKVNRILQYLKDLSVHNNREWFETNKIRYEEARGDFLELLSHILLRISSFDSDVLSIKPEDCIFRIHRDLRFSFDKTPYKTHFGGYINSYGRKAPQSGYYIHLEPENCFLGGGSLYIPTHLLYKIRMNILTHIDEYIDIVEDPAFKHYFPEIGFQRLKSAPRGFSKNNPHLKYIQPKDFLISYSICDSFFNQDKAMNQFEEILQQAKRLADFINFAIDSSES